MFTNPILHIDSIDADSTMSVLANPQAALLTSLSMFVFAAGLLFLVGIFASSVAVVAAHPDWEYEQVQKSLSVRICMYATFASGLIGIVLLSFLDTI